MAPTDRPHFGRRFQPQRGALPSAMSMSVRLLAVRSRQRGAKCNLAAKRAAGVLPEQFGQLLAHAIRHVAFNRLHGATITAVEKLFDRRHTCRLTLGLGGKPCQLSNRLGAVLLGQLLDLGGDLVGGALFAARARPSTATIGP